MKAINKLFWPLEKKILPLFDSPKTSIKLAATLVTLGYIALLVSFYLSLVMLVMQIIPFAMPVVAVVAVCLLGWALYTIGQATAK